MNRLTPDRTIRPAKVTRVVERQVPVRTPPQKPPRKAKLPQTPAGKLCANIIGGFNQFSS